jgi:hypothetical protein
MTEPDGLLIESEEWLDEQAVELISGRAGLVGVPTHDADEDYECGSELIGEGAAWPL